MSGMNTGIRIFPDIHSLSRAAAEAVHTMARAAILERGRFTAALSGGSTPRELYTFLADGSYGGQVDWVRIHLFWADERCVPKEHEASNFRLVQNLLSSRAVPIENVHRIKGEEGAVRAAANYEQDLCTFFGTTDIPVFDLVILGVGRDGHTASLFPGSSQVRECSRLAAPVMTGGHGPDRVTLTLPVLNKAKQVLFLVAGIEKQGVVRSILAEGNPDGLPAGLIHPLAGRSDWYLDKDASALLPHLPNQPS